MLRKPDVRGQPDVHLTTLAWEVVCNQKIRQHVILYRRVEAGDLPGRQTNTSDVLVQHSPNSARPPAELDD
jgi:hypothetical protein